MYDANLVLGGQGIPRPRLIVGTGYSSTGRHARRLTGVSGTGKSSPWRSAGSTPAWRVDPSTTCHAAALRAACRTPRAAAPRTGRDHTCYPARGAGLRRWSSSRGPSALRRNVPTAIAGPAGRPALARDNGFIVMPCSSDDPVMARKLRDPPVRRGNDRRWARHRLRRGIRQSVQHQDHSRESVLPSHASSAVDAGVGTAPTRRIARELGCDGVLMNTPSPAPRTRCRWPRHEAGRRGRAAWPTRGRAHRRSSTPRASSPIERPARLDEAEPVPGH